jgi:hypothetical protein
VGGIDFGCCSSGCSRNKKSATPRLPRCRPASANAGGRASFLVAQPAVPATRARPTLPQQAPPPAAAAAAAVSAAARVSPEPHLFALPCRVQQHRHLAPQAVQQPLVYVLDAHQLHRHLVIRILNYADNDDVTSCR